MIGGQEEQAGILQECSLCRCAINACYCRLQVVCVISVVADTCGLFQPAWQLVELALVQLEHAGVHNDKSVLCPLQRP